MGLGRDQRARRGVLEPGDGRGAREQPGPHPALLHHYGSQGHGGNERGADLLPLHAVCRCVLPQGRAIIFVLKRVLF